MKKPESLTEENLPDLIGHEFEPSGWLKVSQQRINQFADATNDHQFIHVDPERAAKTAFGGPIAHGFLTLSLVSYLTSKIAIKPEGLAMAINYGSDKVRFLQPVAVNSRIRARQKLLDVNQKQPGQVLVKTQVTIDIEGSDKPALVAEFLAMLMFE